MPQPLPDGRGSEGRVTSAHRKMLLCDADWYNLQIPAEYSPQRRLSLWRRVLPLGAVGVMLSASAARADIGPRPGPRNQPQPFQMPVVKAKVTIEVDEKATEARVILPMQVMLGGFNVGGG